MHIQISDRTAFAEAAAAVVRHLPSRPSMPALGGALLEANEHDLVLAGTDGDTSIRIKVSADVVQPGRTVVSGRLLGEIAKLLPKHAITIQADDEKMTIECGASRSSLPLLPVEHYPKLPEFPTLVGEVNAEAFAEAVAGVGSAASSDEAQALYTVMAVDIPDGDAPLRMYATDRYQLAAAEIAFQPSMDLVPGRVMLPARALEAATKALATAGQTVRIGVAAKDGRVGFATERRHVVMGRLDLEAVQFERALQQPAAAEFTVPTGELMAAVKRLALYRDAPRATVALRENELTLEVAGLSGRSEETLAVDYTEAPIEFGFFTSRLVSALQTIRTDLVSISVPGQPNRPWILRQVYDTGERLGWFQHLVMPAKLTSVAKAAA